MRILTRFALYVFAVLVSFLPAVSLAQNVRNVGDMADNITEQTGSILRMAIMFGFVAGAILFLLGLWLIYKEQKQPNQDHGKRGFIALFVGCLLMSAPFFMDVTAGSVGAQTDFNSELGDLRTRR